MHPQIDAQVRCCPYADCVFKTCFDVNYTRHLKTHRKQGTFAYTCSGCKRKFLTSMILGRHERQCIARGPVAAKTCSQNVQRGSEASCYVQFRLAAQKVKPKIANLTSIFQLPNGKFGCPTCDYTSKRKFNDMKHLLTHEDKKPFKCSNVCSYRSKWAVNVRAHEKRQHEGKGPRTSTAKRPNKCPKSSLGVISSNSKNSLFQCTECDYKSNNRRLLISHLKVQSDQRPFPCTFPGCSYRTKWSHWARAHERKIHNGWTKPVSLTTEKSPPPVVPLVVTTAQATLKLPDVKGYKYHVKAPCPHCGLKVRVRFLHRHILVHTDLRPYSCCYCPYRSRWRVDVKTHEQRMHANEPAEKTAGKVCPEVDGTGVPERDGFASRIRATELLKRAAKLLRKDPPKAASESAQQLVSQRVPEYAKNPGRDTDEVGLSLDPTSSIPQDAIPPDSTFVCMLCTFMGSTLESAIMHAASHNANQISDQNN